MPPAIIGGAIAAVGAVGSAVLANKGASAAAKATTDAATTSANAIKDNYGASAAVLQPWQTQGLQANSLLNSGLGIGGTAYQQQAPPQPQSLPYGEGAMAQPYTQDMGYSPNQVGYNETTGQAYPNFGGQFALPQQTAQNTVGTIAAPMPNGAPSAYGNAFGNWLANSDYGFQFAQGSNAVNSGYAGSGVLQSGAAMKGLEKYRQNLQQGYRGEYNALLSNQQGIGFGAASAQAGVSQGLGNSLSNIYTAQGDNLANAALIKSQNTGTAINSLATIGAGIFGQSKYAK